MTKRILILGGYGNFGSCITRKLAAEPDLQVIIAGRSEEKARGMAESLKGAPNPPSYRVLDIEKDFPAALQAAAPDIVIHTSGPFQARGYGVAEACIAQGCHYIDLADGRDFVMNVGALEARAKEKNVAVIAGASSVPCLTAALVDHYRPLFDKITAVDYGITTAQRTNTGLATTAAILGYAGKPFPTRAGGKMRTVYGWQSLHARKYPGLGWRLLGNCDVPDLGLFPQRYPEIESIRFYAGLELAFLHLGLWTLSWLVRLGLLRSLEKYAPALLNVSRWFDVFGGDESGFHMTLSGTGKDGRAGKRTFTLIARDGHGPFIPCIPAILCAKMLARGRLPQRGAFPCVGIITLEQYLEGLKGLNIKTMET